MIPSNTLLVIVVLGVLLTLVGFGLRDRNLGLVLAGIGLIAALAGAVYKAIEVFGGI